MTTEVATPFSPMLRKLESLSPLGEEERQAIVNLPVHIRQLRQDQDILCEGDRPSQCCLLIKGLAYRYKSMGDGRRQIMSFHIPGDMPDVLSLQLRVMDHSVGTLAPCTVGFVAHRDLQRVIRGHPRISDALWRDTLVDAAVFREWMIGIGRRSAYVRIAHLLCEMLARMDAVGLANDNAVWLPLTQEEIGDALGLSTVHVNRVVQQLRADGLITWQSKTLTVKNVARLHEAGEFDPTYLHIEAKTD